VTGKGGVGKTRFSVLLSHGEKKPLFEFTAAAEEEARFLKLPKPHLLSESRQSLSEDFLASVVKISSIAKLISKAKLFQTLLQLAPNLYEILLLKKLVELSKDHPVVVDAPSTGHFIGMFEALKTAQSLFDGGFLKRAADEMETFFQDESQVEVYIVSLPEVSALEEMKIIESRLQELFPRLSVKRILNRKHLPAQEGLDLPHELQKLAYDRPRDEDERIQNLNFDQVLLEGATRL